MARWLKLPLLVGYLLAGMVVGPHTPGVVADEGSVHDTARLGVALLMFAVGTHLSLRELQSMRRIALVGGGLQILLTTLAGFVVGVALGWGAFGGIFVGCALALSSTAVVMRLLEERGELGTSHGSAMLAVLVVQDLAVILMVALLPALQEITTQGAAALGSVGLSLLKALGSLTATLLLASRLVPALLARVARTGSRELFLLVVVCICFAAGLAAKLVGLSLELGAFLAGVVISESDYAHEVFSEVRPLRDIFAALFFVSVGMLMDPRLVVKYWVPVTAVVLTIVGAKALITGAAVYLAGAHGRTAVIAALGLAQIGEFSFVLATMGSRRGLISDEISAVLLAAALITILLTPFMFQAARPLYVRLSRIPTFGRILNRHAEVAPSPHRGTAQVIILGCGRVGRYVSDALRAMEIPHRVVDYDAAAIQRLQEAGVPVTYGDATSEIVLKHIHPDRARLAIIALPEAQMTEMAIRIIQRLAPALPIVARVHRGIDIPRIRAAGADAVIHAEFEAGTEMIRQGLDRLGIPDPAVDTYLEQVRQHRYRQEGWEGA